MQEEEDGVVRGIFIFVGRKCYCCECYQALPSRPYGIGRLEAR